MRYNFTTGNSGIKQTSSVIPKSFQLFQNYQNPFNPETKIRFDIQPLNPPLSKGGRGLALRGVSLKIYDITGREITTLVNESLQPGNYEITFDGSNLSSGINFYKLIAGDFISIKKMLLIK